jgi:hypothetical protein
MSQNLGAPHVSTSYLAHNKFMHQSHLRDAKGEWYVSSAHMIQHLVNEMVYCTPSSNKKNKKRTQPFNLLLLCPTAHEPLSLAIRHKQTNLAFSPFLPWRNQIQQVRVKLISEILIFENTNYFKPDIVPNFNEYRRNLNKARTLKFRETMEISELARI